MTLQEELLPLTNQIRRDIIRQVHGVQSGHPGGSLGCVEIVASLFFKIMHHNPAFNMDAKGEDVFFLSNGHISPLLYSVLARAGYFDVAELATFRKLDSRLQGHPATAEHLPGVRIASGSLGQGISVAIGTALSKKLNGDDKTVFVLTGDGELQEGQIWEAAMYAPHNRIDNLVAIVDYNGQQIDGPVDKILGLLSLRAKFEAFGWHVLNCEAGNDMDAVYAALAEAKASLGNGKPAVVLMKTVMGHGVDFMAGSHKWHGIAPSDEQLANGLAQLPTTLQDY